MEPRNEKESRFRIHKLEARIAPGAAAGALVGAFASAETALDVVPEGTEDLVVGTVLGSNPESGAC